MPEILPWVPRNMAAEASATNAIKSVYSIRSCPFSSRQKRFTYSRNECIAIAPGGEGAAPCGHGSPPDLALLCGRAGRVGQLRVRGGPDRLDGAACAQKQRRGGQCHKRDQQRILDQVL